MFGVFWFAEPFFADIYVDTAPATVRRRLTILGVGR